MRTFARKISLFCATLALMLLTCEVATRTFSSAANSLSQRDTQIGRRYYPNLDQFVFNAESGEPIRFRTNQVGFRGPHLSIDKPPGVCRIAVVGDSYTASEALAEEETFCGQLERMLNQRSKETTWEVLNFGVSGSGTGQELALYRNEIQKLDADILIVAFGNATDVRDNSSELGGNPIIHFALDDQGKLFQLPQNESRVTVSNFLNRTSLFYRWQKAKVTSLKNRLRKQVKQAEGRHLIYVSDEPPAYKRAWNLTSEILKTFRRECEENETQLMVAAIPSAVQVHPDHLKELVATSGGLEIDPSHPDRRLGQICGKHGIPFLSLVDEFASRAPSGKHQTESEQLFLGGVGHLNAAGSEVAALEMHDWIAAERVALKSGSTTR